MIDHINNRLQDWLQWRAAVVQRAYGYRSPLADIRDSRGCVIASTAGGGQRTVAAYHGPQEAHLELEQAVRDLSAPLQRLVLLVYAGVQTLPELDTTLRQRGSYRARALTTNDVCAICGCAKSTLFARLHTAHVRIMEDLQDMEVSRRHGTENRLTSTARAGHNPSHSAKVAKVASKA